jgi:hypothetical protein
LLRLLHLLLLLLLLLLLIVVHASTLLLLLLLVALVPSSSSMEVFLRREEGETRQEEEEQLRFRRTNHSGSKLKEKGRRNKGKHTRQSLQPNYEQRTLPACLPTTTMRARFFTFYCA